MKDAMSGFIPETERVITIEDSAELQIRQIPNSNCMRDRDLMIWWKVSKSMV